MKLTKVGKTQLPLKVDRISIIKNICDEVLDLNNRNTSEAKGTSDFDALCLLQVTFILSILDKFKSEKCSFHLIVSFISEQLELLVSKKRNYSNDYLIFSSIFFNLSPHAYKFVRGSSKIILPCYTTIRKLSSSSSMDPFQEQSDKTFLFYIKQKFKALTDSDKTVSLLLDEIHLKPYFDFKGGNIVWSGT